MSGASERAPRIGSRRTKPPSFSGTLGAVHGMGGVTPGLFLCPSDGAFVVHHPAASLAHRRLREAIQQRLAAHRGITAGNWSLHACGGTSFSRSMGAGAAVRSAPPADDQRRLDAYVPPLL